MIAFVSDVPGIAGLVGLDGAGGESPRLDHIGIAVRSVSAARLLFEALGMSVSAEETVEHERVRAAMVTLGDSRLELIEPTSEDSTIGRFLDKRGEGMHHLAIHVGDIDAKFAELKVRGVRLVGESVRIGAGGHRYFFVHPASTGGVLIEIVGDAMQAGKRVQR